MQRIKANQLLSGIGSVSENTFITSVVTDSRNVEENSLFVCIKGEKVDGHDYAKTALEKGAKVIVATHYIDNVPKDCTVLVSDALDAMIAIGANYRKCYSPVLVGVTGSVGKTTTKEFCYAVFSSFGDTIKTLGNQNNEIGMPNTLMRIDDGTKYAVIEMGMQGLGEIEKLTMAAKPCGAIITGIGVSHLEQLKTRENICTAKLEICKGLADNSPIVLNGDDDLLINASLPKNVVPVLFATKNIQADVFATNIKSDENGTSFKIVDKIHGELEAYIPTSGNHNVMDAISAYALATRLGLSPHQCAKALSGYETTGHRQNLVKHNGVFVFEDCYNASPESMRAALEMLGSYPVAGRRIAVLGDMFELGSATKQAHVQIGELCYENKIDFLITVGDAMQDAHERAHGLGIECLHCENKQAAVKMLCDLCKENDTILVKASHGMAFEQILNDFYIKFK